MSVEKEVALCFQNKHRVLGYKVKRTQENGTGWRLKTEIGEVKRGHLSQRIALIVTVVKSNKWRNIKSLGNYNRSKLTSLKSIVQRRLNWLVTYGCYIKVTVVCQIDLFFVSKNLFFLNILWNTCCMTLIFLRPRGAMLGGSFTYLQHFDMPHKKFSRAT